MDILNLLEAQFATNMRDVKASTSLGSTYAPKTKDLEKGSFSAVKPDSKDPHMVKKFARMARSENDEGFKAFVMFLHKNGFDDNIHMPRVYDVKTIRGNDGIIIDSYKMEKLIPMHAIPRKELYKYYQHIAPNKDIQFLKFMPVDDYLHSSLAGLISSAISHEPPDFAIDTLNQACKIVADAIVATGGTKDIYPDNLMFRRTAQGIQIVFSDPIAIPLN